MKALVLEIRNGEAAVLREDGIVVKTRQVCQVGDTIDVPETLEMSSSRRWRSKRIMRSMVAAVLAICIIGGSFGYMTVSASSYVSVDAGDASIEISVNHFGRVIGVTAMDEESEELADAISREVKGKRFGPAMETAVARLEESGSLGEDASVVGVTAGSDRQKKEIQDSLESCFGKGGEKPSYITMDVTFEDRNEAREHKQSPGMYVFERDHGGKRPEGQNWEQESIPGGPKDWNGSFEEEQASSEDGEASELFEGGGFDPASKPSQERPDDAPQPPEGGPFDGQPPEGQRPEGQEPSEVQGEPQGQPPTGQGHPQDQLPMGQHAAPGEQHLAENRPPFGQGQPTRP